MEIVYEEKHGASAIERDRRRRAWRRGSARGSYLRLFATAAGRNAIQEGNVARLALYLEEKLIAFDVIDELALFVKDHEIRLYQIGVDAHHFIGLLLRNGRQGSQTAESQ
jgi:DNA-binding IclR family transcriptional regulator